MKHMHRVHGVSISSLHEIVGKTQKALVTLKYCPTDQMRADIYTTPFTSGPRYHHALSLIGIVPDSMPSATCAPCAVAPIPARRSGSIGKGKGFGDGKGSSCSGGPSIAKVGRSDSATQTDGVDGRSTSKARTRKQRLDIPALVAMGRPLRPSELWPFEAQRRGNSLWAEVVDQLHSEAIHRLHMNHTLSDATSDFARYTRGCYKNWACASIPKNTTHGENCCG